jgi:hypothetical protein
MPNGALGFNLTDFQLSRENVTADLRSLGGAFCLVRNSPALAANAIALGIQTVYRHKSEGSNDDAAVNYDPAAFVDLRHREAPHGALIHLSNEIEPSEALDTWTFRAMLACEQRGRKAVIFNHATHKTRAQWERSLPILRYAAANGHYCGCHVYARDGQWTGADDWLPVMRAVGGRWLITEFGWIANIQDAYNGWRGRITEHEYGNFLELHAARYAREGIATLLFSYDQWPNNDSGRASGFGVEDRAPLKSRLAELNTRVTMQPTIVADVPKPADAGTGVSRKLKSGVNFRGAPSTSGRIIRGLTTDTALVWYPGGQVVSGGYTWAWVEVGSDSGWIARVTPEWDDLLTAPPSVGIPAWTLTDDEIRQSIAAWNKQIAALEEMKAAAIAQRAIMEALLARRTSTAA